MNDDAVDAGRLRYITSRREGLKAAFQQIPVLVKEADSYLCMGHPFAEMRASILMSLVSRISATAAARLRAEAEYDTQPLQGNSDEHKALCFHYKLDRAREMEALNYQLDGLLTEMNTLENQDNDKVRSELLARVVFGDSFYGNGKAT